MSCSHPVGSVLIFVVDGERYPETLGTAGSLVRRFEVRRWLNLELRSAEVDLLALTNPGYAWQSHGGNLREIGHGQPWRGDMRQALELAQQYG